jgi:raffinose/stachyose/melibiose transport system permease protein
MSQKGFNWQRFATKTLPLIPQYLIAIIVSLIVLFPIAIAILGGFKTTGELLNRPFALPNEWLAENYAWIINHKGFWQQLLNSCIVMVGTVALTMLSASMAAFVFARMSFKGRDLLFNYLMIGLLFPVIVAILPLFLLMRQLHLTNSLMGMILVQAAYGIPGTILVLRGFFRALPRDLEDAAYIDGCTSFGFFWRVLLRLSTPALAANAALGMVGSWNALFLPLVVLDKEEMWTLPLGTMQFQGQYATEWSRVMAFVVLAMIPAVIFYLLAERYIVSGLTGGSLKG